MSDDGERVVHLLRQLAGLGAGLVGVVDVAEQIGHEDHAVVGVSAEALHGKDGSDEEALGQSATLVSLRWCKAKLLLKLGTK